MSVKRLTGHIDGVLDDQPAVAVDGLPGQVRGRRVVEHDLELLNLLHEAALPGCIRGPVGEHKQIKHI